jgi:hypothetical protein
MSSISLGTFLVKTRDPFDASVSLWWTAENFVDITAYINDARAMDLTVVAFIINRCFHLSHFNDQPPYGAQWS